MFSFKNLIKENCAERIKSRDNKSWAHIVHEFAESESNSSVDSLLVN